MERNKLLGEFDTPGLARLKVISANLDGQAGVSIWVGMLTDSRKFEVFLSEENVKDLSEALRSSSGRG